MLDVVLDTNVVSDHNNVTVVEATAMISTSEGTTLYSATGSSRRHPDDHFDQEIAISLASGRAVKALGRKITRDAQDRVRIQARAADKQREASERAAAMKAERAEQIRADIKKKSKKAKKRLARKSR